MEEFGPYYVDDLIKQSGDNRGAINDKSLAEIGAKAENTKRNQIKKGILVKNSNKLTKYLGNAAGEKAMMAEVKTRAMEILPESTLQKERDKFGTSAAYDFIELHDDKVDERENCLSEKEEIELLMRDIEATSEVLDKIEKGEIKIEID